MVADIATWRQVRDSWQQLKTSARIAGDERRMTSADAQLELCERHIASAEAKLAELDVTLSHSPHLDSRTPDPSESR